MTMEALISAACARRDATRDSVPFSAELSKASQLLWATDNDGKRAAILKEWIVNHQVCKFGHIAARNDMIAFCFVDERDVALGDEAVRSKIQLHRLNWLNKARLGNQHAFIVMLVSQRVSECEPSTELMQVALRLCSLCLLEDVSPDGVFLESIFLDVPATPHAEVWMWPAGVNVFCPQGDGRWWQDHRIPGGIAFSINSVGHMVKSAAWKNNYKKYAEAVGVEDQAQGGIGMTSLAAALGIAMRTIDRASKAVSGKATWLEPRDDSDSQKRVCPLGEWSSSVYGGYYHTDHTVPSCYFRPAVERPSDMPSFTLDFTYLHDASAANVDSIRLGAGRRIKLVDSHQDWRLRGVRVEGAMGRTTEELLDLVRSK